MSNAIIALALTLSTTAAAAEPVDDNTSTFDPDVKPEAPTVDLPDPAQDTKTYAGVGSNTAYSERGVGEFGGSMALSFAPETAIVSADPMIGYFLFDNFEMSGILGLRHTSVSGESSNRFTALLEPSIHLPINDGLFWVGGLGAGVALADNLTLDGGVSTGFAMAPRTGIQLLIGRSGLFNLGARYAAVFSNADADLETFEGRAVVAFANSFDVQAGYTVMF